MCEYGWEWGSAMSIIIKEELNIDLTALLYMMSLLCVRNLCGSKEGDPKRLRCNRISNQGTY